METVHHVLPGNRRNGKKRQTYQPHQLPPARENILSPYKSECRQYRKDRGIDHALQTCVPLPVQDEQAQKECAGARNPMLIVRLEENGRTKFTLLIGQQHAFPFRVPLVRLRHIRAVTVDDKEPGAHVARNSPAAIKKIEHLVAAPPFRIIASKPTQFCNRCRQRSQSRQRSRNCNCRR